MRKIATLLAFLILFCSSVHAFSLGVIVGTPTGFSFQTYPFNGAVASNYFHLDYISYSLGYPFYFGIGGSSTFDNAGSRIVLRVPLGIELRMPTSPLQIFVEAVPRVDFAQTGGLDMGAAVGLRLMFY